MQIDYTHTDGRNLYTDWQPLKVRQKDIESEIPDDCFVQIKGKEYRIGRKMPINCKKENS